MRPASDGGYSAAPCAVTLGMAVSVNVDAPRELEPMSPGPTVDFGEPIGEGDTIHTRHSEVRTFGESFGCREAAFRLSLAPAVLEHVRDLVGASEERIAEVARSASPPSANTLSIHGAK